MFYVLQNESTAARRRCPILLTDSATGTTGQSGIALTNIYPYVSINGGAFAGGAGTVAEVNFGQYYYEFAPAEITTLGLAGIHITAAGCRDYDAIVQIAAFNLYSASTGTTAGDVWSYADRKITGGIADTVTTLTNRSGFAITGGTVDTVTNDVSVSTTSMSGIANTVWSTDISGYTSPSAGYELSNVSAGGGISAYDVWAFDYINAPGGVVPISAAERLEETRTESYAASNNTNAIIGAQYPISDIWQWDSSTNTDPSVGYNLYQLGIGATGYAGGGGITAGDVWNYTLGSTQSADATITQIASETNTIITLPGATASDVWAYTLPNSINAETNLISAASGVTAGDVWSYASRTITGGIADTVQLVATPVNVSTSSMSGIANSVWDFVITGFGQTGSAAQYSTQTLFTVGNIETYVASQTPQDVWTYAGIEGRTITGGLADTVTTLTNRAGFSITGGTITTVSDKTGYSLSASQTFNLTGNITGNVSGSVGSVTNPVSVATTSMTGIAGSVWNSLTSAYSTNGTYGLNVLRADQANKVGDVTLYSSGGVNGVDADVHRIANDTAAATSLKNILTGVGGETLTANITGNLSGSVNSVTQPVSLSTATQASIANSVWITDVSSYASPSAGYDLSNATAGGGITAGDVWSYATRTITGGIADTVTTLTNRSGFAITGGTVDTVTNGVTVTTNNDKTGYSLSGTQSFNLTGNITGNLSGSVGSVSGNVGGNVVGSVASVTNPVIFDSAQYASIASSVWNAGTRTLTSGGSGISAYDVWNFVLSDANTAEVDLVTAASGAGISAADVWTYGSRTITGGIANTVTNVTNGVIVTTNNDKTGYELSGAGVSAVQSGLSTLTQAQVGTEVDASLSDVGLTSTVTGRIDATISSRLASSSYTAPPTTAAIASSVWSEPTRTITGGTITTNSDKTGYSLSSSQTFNMTGNITGNLSGSVGSVTADVNVSTSSMSGIAGTVWSYTPRTLTSGAGATAGDVWTYPTRSLTSGAGITVNAATNIINGPYFVKSNVDSQDGTLDVIRGMVQDIQLTVTDAFQNPFDTTALGLLVNFYDQAGTLTTSYATTELYGPAGLVQFTLDTAVTGVEGRYNLILSAAGSGNTIKFGPLQTLVRPF